MTQTNGTIWNYSYFYGVEISKDEIEQGYINYSTLAKGLGDVILANEVIPQTMAKGFYWEIEQGTDYNEETEEYIDIYQYYIISHRAAESLGVAYSNTSAGGLFCSEYFAVVDRLETIAKRFGLVREFRENGII